MMPHKLLPIFIHFRHPQIFTFFPFFLSDIAHEHFFNCAFTTKASTTLSCSVRNHFTTVIKGENIKSKPFSIWLLESFKSMCSYLSTFCVHEPTRKMYKLGEEPVFA
ncbi:unnamed protein product [Clavelina lepadiformis]|uniref:Uncharacterized protein n=1 Tax=Clavelina lepadiformis TaxID=159417 RepID=A0ABP0EY46_CLALP